MHDEYVIYPLPCCHDTFSVYDLALVCVRKWGGGGGGRGLPCNAVEMVRLAVTLSFLAQTVCETKRCCVRNFGFTALLYSVMVSVITGFRGVSDAIL